jgi:hypothetical protein
MRIQLIFISLSFCFSAFSVTDAEVKELFSKYDTIMGTKEIGLIDEVFTKKFIHESGGKKALILKIKGLPVPLIAKNTSVSWKEGRKGRFYLARYKEISDRKNASTISEADFILVREKSKLKIDGTISDGN